MEERIIERENERKIRVKRTADGDIQNVEDELAPESETEETEVSVDFPEEAQEEDAPEEYDESLVGLTPSQLEKELERREKLRREAYAERDKLLAGANEMLEKSKYAEAEEFCRDALVYDGSSDEAQRLLWIAMTKDFTDDAPFYKEENARSLASSGEDLRSFVLSRAGKRLRDGLAQDLAEEAPVAARVEEAQNRRRGAFAENRRYYLVRLVALSCVILLFVVGCIVSMQFIVRTKSVLPIVLAAAFGGLAVVVLVFWIVFARKLLVADRYCRANEQLSSTEDGATLLVLRNRIRCARLALGEEDGETQLSEKE